MDLTRFVQYIFGFIALAQIFSLVASIGTRLLFTSGGRVPLASLAHGTGWLLASIACIFLLQRYHEHIHGKQGSATEARRLIKSGLKAGVIVAIAGVLFALVLMGAFIYAFSRS
jgi:hypothetical protein